MKDGRGGLPRTLTGGYQNTLRQHTRNRPGAPVASSREAPGTEARSDLLHEIFEAQADARPDAVAVVFGPQRRTYADLEEKANRLARHLRDRGVERGSLVAMVLHRSIDTYAALLGILKAGAAYVPLDPEYPPDRVAYILEDCGADALVTTGELADVSGGFGGVIVRLG